MCALISTITLSNEQQAAQALSRSEVYLFLSRAFLYPQEDLQPFYQRARFAVHTLGEQDLFAPPEVPPLPTLKQEYVHTFGHTTPKDYSPYETDYGQSHIFMQSQALMALASFYRAFGLEAARGERLDHIGPELEFMYFLTYKEAYSLAHKRTRRADTCREGQRLFLERHLGRWTPLFLQRLEKRCEGFYAYLAGQTRAWLKVEVERVGAHPSTVEVGQPQASALAFHALDRIPAPCEGGP